LRLFQASRSKILTAVLLPRNPGDTFVSAPIQGCRGPNQKFNDRSVAPSANPGEFLFLLESVDGSALLLGASSAAIVQSFAGVSVAQSASLSFDWTG
jgi:hypothetical protein